MKKRNTPARRPGAPARACQGPIADLESHLPEEWWREIFNALYLKTDGDVVENDGNTRHDIDLLINATGIAPQDDVLDLCCGQGRHVLELARRGFGHVMGIDRSRYLVRLARRRAQDKGLSATFREGDARSLRLPEASQDCVSVMGNSFGYFAAPEDDARVLRTIGKILRPSGTLALDLTQGDWLRENFEARSWEWIDANQFVCRERSLSSDGARLISREVVVHAERGVIADQFYAERLYSPQQIQALLEEVGFRGVRLHAEVETESSRHQDLGMMARRMFLTASAPQRKVRKGKAGKAKPRDVAVLLGDPRLPDTVKLNGQFNAEDFETIRRLKDGLAELPGFTFRYFDNHATFINDLRKEPPELAFNLCDEGWNNDAFMELHVPAFLEANGIPYTGAGPACLGACYDKALVRAVAQQLDVPVPLETYVRADDQSATLPATFPALLKPNFGDSSIGITKDAVVHSSADLLAYLEVLRRTGITGPVLVQEFLTGGEYSVALIGNPDHGLRALPILEVDYGGLDAGLPQILGYESKWIPDSPYWTQIRYREAELPGEATRALISHSERLFERLRCRDYARFDFRADADGEIKLLEVNPNPGWCWDGKMNLMAGFAGMRYSEFLGAVLTAAEERVFRGSSVLAA